MRHLRVLLAGVAVGVAIGLAKTAFAGPMETSSENAVKAEKPLARVVSRKVASRKLANGGQGLVMLDQLKQPAPTFLQRKQKRLAPVRFSGHCQDAYGVLYHAADPGYAQCVSASRQTLPE